MNASSSVGSGSAVRPCAGFQIVGRSACDHAPAIDERDAIAILGLVEKMRGHHHRDAALHERIYVRPKFATRQRIDARRRLVEKENWRLVHDRAGERQSLLIAGRQGSGVCFHVPLQTERLRHALNGAPAARAVEPVDPREELEVLGDAEVTIERELLRHVAKPVPRDRGLPRDVEARDAGFA